MSLLHKRLSVRWHQFAIILSGLIWLSMPVSAWSHFESVQPISLIDCEGSGCGNISVTWDEPKQQYRVQNSSADQWIRVEAANLAATAMICVGAGKTEYLSLSSIVGSYKATIDATCAN